MTLENNSRQIRELERTLHDHMELFGYRLIDVPVIEDADIFLTRAGNSIIEQLFTFERAGRLLALRPEFTAVVAHRYTQADYSNPVRWQLSGTIFVDEPSDISQQYEKHTIGAELLNQTGIMPEAEIVAMATQGVEKLDLSDWQLIIGHVGLQSHLLSRFGLDNRTYRILLTQRDRLKKQGKQAVLNYLSEFLPFNDSDERIQTGDVQETRRVLDVLLDSTRYGSTMGGRNRHDIATRLLKKHDRSMESHQISQALDFLGEWGNIRGNAVAVASDIRAFIADDDDYGQQLFDEWYQMIELLRSYGISDERIILQPDLTKNWDYYTGIVFGIRAGERYVASGGRYDGLTQLLGGQDAIPAVGFAYYTEDLMDVLPEIDSAGHSLTLSGDSPLSSVKWASILRESQIAIEIVADYADITVSDDSAHYKNSDYSPDALIQELTQ